MKHWLSVVLAALMILSTTGTALAAPATGEANVAVEYHAEEQAARTDAPAIGCRAAYIADPETGKVYYELNAHQPLYPASTTKLLTALLVVENCALTDHCVVSPDALKNVPSDYIDADLVAGETLSVLDLLRVLLIPSANDAAFVLAEHVSGSVSAFVERMNERARELGCEAVHFVNPNGIHNSEHTCTAYDLFLIGRECQKHAALREIFQSKSCSLPATAQYPSDDRVFVTTNEMLLPGANHYAYCTGLKTGHTDAAGECLVAGAEWNGMTLLSVVLGGKIHDGVNDRFQDTRRLFDYVLSHYAKQTLAAGGDVAATLNVGHATNRSAALDALVAADVTAILPDTLDKSQVDVRLALYKEIDAPVAQGQVLGEITYRADGLVYTTTLVAAQDVARAPYWLYNLAVVGVVIATAVLAFVAMTRARKRYRKKMLAVTLGIVVVEIVLALVLVKVCTTAATSTTQAIGTVSQTDTTLD